MTTQEALQFLQDNTTALEQECAIRGAHLVTANTRISELETALANAQQAMQGADQTNELNRALADRDQWKQRFEASLAEVAAMQDRLRQLTPA